MGRAHTGGGPQPAATDPAPGGPWKWLRRAPRPADAVTTERHLAMLRRLHDIARELDDLAARVGDLENDRGGDTPVAYRIGEIGEELDGMSHG